MRVRALPLVIALSLATAPLTIHLPHAIAQGMDADTKEAKTLFEDGVKLYKANKFEEARVKFKAAYGLKRRPSIVLNLAHAELQTKRYLDAITHFKEVQAIADAKPDDKDEAKQGLADARKQVGVIMVDAPTGTALTIDGEARTVPADNAIEVLPGAHTVVLKSGGKDVVQKVDLAAGQTVEVKAKADAPPVATTPPPTPTETAAPAPTDTAPPVATAAPTPTATTAPPQTGPREPFLKTVHPIAFVGAAGVVVFGGLWIGSYLASQTAFSNADEYAAAYRRPTCGTPESAGKPCTSAARKTQYRELGLEELDSGGTYRALAIVSGVLTIVSIAAVVTGVTVLRKKNGAAVSVVGAPMYGGGASFAIIGQF